MLTYLLIGLSLVLVGIVGLQFSYLFYVDRVIDERKRYLRDLEHRHTRLAERLEAAEFKVAEQNETLDALYSQEEIWADLIEDR